MKRRDRPVRSWSLSAQFINGTLHAMYARVDYLRGSVNKSIQVDERVVLDYAENGDLLGIEVLGPVGKRELSHDASAFYQEALPVISRVWRACDAKRLVRNSGKRRRR